jgi:hypothetical protein
VRAADLGLPSLDSTISIMIRVRQVVTVAPDSGVGFGQLEHRVNLPENVAVRGLVATLPLEMKPPAERRLRIRCEVVSVRDNNGDRVKGRKGSELKVWIGFSNSLSRIHLGLLASWGR